jgi:hypothetical protein
MGHTLTLDIPEDVYQLLVQKAEQTGQLPETVAVQLLTTVVQPQSTDPLEQFIGAFDSQGADWADRHDANLGRQHSMHRQSDAMIANPQEFLVSLEQLKELELALAGVKREASSPISFRLQATSIQKEICRIRHEIDTYLGVTDLQISEYPH